MLETTTASPEREVRYEYSLNWNSLLARFHVSLLVTTYQAGKFIAVGTGPTGFALSIHNVDRPMGLAVSPDRIAIGARQNVWVLKSAPALASQVGSPGSYDACYLTRSSFFTNDIQTHEMAWCGGELWVVNTLFSCLCTLGEDHSFYPHWRPKFISALASEDRCHLNGLALEAGKPKYVTAFAETDTERGWRPVKATGGCLIDIPSREIVARGFCMPHSPRVHEGRIWLADSGTGRLLTADRMTGKAEVVATLPGYPRGLDFFGPFAVVGLSKIRETSTFGGVPLAAQRDMLKCGIALVELATGDIISMLVFHSGVEEIFDVRVLANTRMPYLAGPHPDLDDQPAVWTVPESARHLHQ